jgi:hypothetical protein
VGYGEIPPASPLSAAESGPQGRIPRQGPHRSPQGLGEQVRTPTEFVPSHLYLAWARLPSVPPERDFCAISGDRSPALQPLTPTTKAVGPKLSDLGELYDSGRSFSDSDER